VAILLKNQVSGELMLTHTASRQYSLEEDVDFIHNYYERRVLQEILNTSSRAQQDREFLADVACVALNRLPPRYIRHNVDMTFFMSPQETQEIEDKVTQAVSTALSYVESRERGDDVELSAAEIIAPKTKKQATPKKETAKKAKKN
jgi:hypothetical protein